MSGHLGGSAPTLAEAHSHTTESRFKVRMLAPLDAPLPILAAVLLLALAVALRLLWIDQVKMSSDEVNHYYIEASRYRPGAVATMDLVSDLRFHFSSPDHLPGSGKRSAHPLLPVVLMGAGEAFAANGTGARLVNGLFGLATAWLLFLTVRGSRGLTAAVFALGLASLMPLAVRFNRTLYLDPAFAFGWALLVYLLCRMSVAPRPGTAIGAGGALALVISTKTSGLLALPLLVAGALAGRGQSTSLRRSAWLALVALASAGILATALNDPVAYLQSVASPADPDYQNRSVANWLWYSTQPVSLGYLLGVAIFLISPPVVLLAAAGAATALRGWASAPAVDRVALTGLAAASPVLALHLPGISAEHGYLAFMPFIVLLATRGLYSVVGSRWRTAVATAVLLTMIPLSALYGLRVAPLPYPSYLNAVDFGQEHYTFDREPLRQR
jgi:hypothetical protein